jgi:hypothetical protein
MQRQERLNEAPNTGRIYKFFCSNGNGFSHAFVDELREANDRK